MINVKSTLQIEIKSYQESKNDFLFDYKLNFKILPFIIDKTIIICSTCKSAISTIDYIFKNDTRLKNTKLNLNFDDEKIKNYVEKGLGYLHGKLTENDKSKIIDLYNEGSIIILATTIQLKNVKCNNLIVKNTKKYSSTGYTDYNLKEIIDFMHYVNENGSVYLLTTNKCYNFYDNIFKKNENITSEDYLSNKDDKKIEYFNFSILENHIPEFVLYYIYTEDSDSEYIKNKIQKSFFYYKLGVKKDDLNLDFLIDEIITTLMIKRFIYKNENKICLNDIFINLFFKSKLSFDIFNFFAEFKGEEEGLVNEIIYNCDFFFISKNDRKNFYKNLLNGEIEKKSFHYNEFIRILEIIIQIREFTKMHLSMPVILFYKIKSCAGSEKLKKINICLNESSFNINNIKIQKCDNNYELNTANQKEYWLIIEKQNIVILSTKFVEEINFEIKEENFYFYLIDMNNFHKNLLLVYNENVFFCNKKYHLTDKSNYIKNENNKKVKNANQYGNADNTEIDKNLFIEDKLHKNAILPNRKSSNHIIVVRKELIKSNEKLNMNKKVKNENFNKFKQKTDLSNKKVTQKLYSKENIKEYKITKKVKEINGFFSNSSSQKKLHFQNGLLIKNKIS
ncbi:ATP-dependent DNA helicase MER3 [Gurleya vavrai]